MEISPFIVSLKGIGYVTKKGSRTGAVYKIWLPVRKNRVISASVRFVKLGSGVHACVKS